MVRALSVLIVALLVAQPAYASDPLAIVLLKAMSYERELPNRVGDAVVIAVPVPQGRSNPQFFKSLKSVEKVRLAKKALRISRVDFASASVLERKLGEVSADFVFVSSKLSPEQVRDVLAACETSKIPTVGVSKALVERGVGLGVELVSNKPRIFVNARSSKLQGAKYSSDLLELAIPVR